MAGALTSRRALLLHALLLVLIPTFAALAWWQVHRALSGNTLSWAYAFEWPLFAAYAVYMWWKLLHDEPGTSMSDRPVGGATADAPGDAGRGGGSAEGPAAGSVADPTEDAELAAYNRYLAELDAHGRRPPR